MISNLKTKKVILLFLFLFCFFLTHTVGFAKPVTVDTAMQVAANWMLQQTGIEHQALEDSVILLEDGAEDRITPYYIFNMDSGGWVIVSGDDIAYPIIGYAVQGAVDAEDFPPAFSEWMAQIEEQITEAVKNDPAPLARIETTWENLDVTDYEVHYASYGAVSPLIKTTWSQEKYYNTSCPADSAGPDGHALVGCCAVAIGQVMKYHNWPVIGTGSHSYYHSTYGTLSADFGATTYNWSSMRASGQVTSYNTAVATLLYHVGVSVDMDYGPSFSSCSLSNIATGFGTYFKYKPVIHEYRSSYSTSAWQGKLTTDLDAGRPIVYNGTGTGGHAFVCDGYTGTDYFHFNWGWNGSYDGYFYLNDLTPDSYDFSFDQGAIFGIEPGGGGGTPEITSPTPGSTLSCESQAFQWTDNDTPVTEWWLYLGSSQGANNYYTSGSLGTSASHTVTSCWPEDGSTIWARLWYRTGGSWESEDFQYIAPTGCTAEGFNSQFNGDASGWEVHYGTCCIASRGIK
jgi:hypothetical protein